MPQNLDYTKTKQSTHEEVMIAIRNRLRAAVPGLNDRTCFLSDQPVPAAFHGGGYCVTISPGPGTFPPEYQSGGGWTTLTEEATIIVTPMIQINLDRVPQAERALLAGDRGLLSLWKYRILRVLMKADPDSTTSKQWEPAIGDRPLLRNSLLVVSASAPADIPDRDGWIGMQIVFRATWDWDLMGGP